ncbi:MAG: methyl-accepting chemotaxis protein [Gammaproteobacteria bacterium]|nr:methyl-accepting chemotaxis protein [Gammaproteobacteria bacterium]
MQARGSLQRKLILSVSGALAVLLAIAGYFVTAQIAAQTEAHVESEAASLLEVKAQEVTSFFTERARVPLTFFNNPAVLEWLDNHRSRGANLDNDPSYQAMLQAFREIVSADPTIKSIFVGSAQTYEYFYEQGRVGVATEGADAGDASKGYFTNKRPWWQQALAQDRLYLTSPQVDATDKTVSSVLQMTVYHKSGRLAGVAGVDILITTVADLMAKIRFQDQGRAFLINEQQEIVYFPSDANSLELNQPLAEIDQAFSATQGFSELARAISQSPRGRDHLVTLDGIEYRVFYVPVRAEVPYINWTLGVLIPQAVISEPIEQAVWFSVSVIVLIIVALSLITWLISLKIVHPVKAIADAMSDIAHGDGDLTRRLTIVSNDEVGDVAREFNRFVDRIQALISEATDNSEKVSQTADRVSDAASKLNQEVVQERGQMDKVAASVSQMMSVSHSIGQHVNEANSVVEKVSDSVNIVSQNSLNTQRVIAEVSHSISKAREAAQALNDDVGEIGAVLDVIKNIAEQTNLLALNAAIEAARAGEQGRGFAVVADEVRVLATRTQESTDHIQKTIEKLQSGAAQVKSSMEQSDEMSDEGVQQVEQVLAAIEQINSAVTQVNQVNRTISDATLEQDQIATTIDNNLSAIHRLTELMVEHSGAMDNDSNQLNALSSELQKIVHQFKI